MTRSDVLSQTNCTSAVVFNKKHGQGLGMIDPVKILHGLIAMHMAAARHAACFHFISLKL